MKILIIDDILPDPSFGVGFPRAYEILLAISNLSHEIEFYQTGSWSGSWYGGERGPPINHAALKARNISMCYELVEKDFDRVIISRPHNMFFHMHKIRKLYPKAKLIYDMEALWYKRYELQQQITGKMPAWWKYDEIKMAKEADLCIVVSKQEKNILLKSNVKNITVLGHTLTPKYNKIKFNERVNYLMVGGNMEEESSNEDAVWWFINECWKDEKSNLVVVGKKTSPRLSESNNVKFIGFVKTLTKYYENCRVFVAPTRFSAGIPLKVYEAMANGIPCVISKLLATQMNILDGSCALIAETKEEFIKSCHSLYENEILWNKLKNNSYKLIIKNCNIQKFKTKLKSIIR